MVGSKKIGGCSATGECRSGPGFWLWCCPIYASWQHPLVSASALGLVLLLFNTGPWRGSWRKRTKSRCCFTSCLALGRATSSPFGRKQRNTQTRTKTLSSPDIGLSFCFAAFHANNNNLRPPGAYGAMSHGACCLLWRCIAFSSTLRVQYDHSSAVVFCVVSDD